VYRALNGMGSLNIQVGTYFCDFNLNMSSLIYKKARKRDTGIEEENKGSTIKSSQFRYFCGGYSIVKKRCIANQKDEHSNQNQCSTYLH
jgi:hypothetical protein